MVNSNGKCKNLKRGGNYGNVGGGRMPDEIRRRWRELGWKCISELERRDLKGATVRELVAIADVASRYGLGTSVSVKHTSEEPGRRPEPDERALQAILASRFPEHFAAQANLKA